MSKDKWVKDRWAKISDDLYFGGDFSHDPEVEARQLAYAQSLGIRTFVDLRDEADEVDREIAEDHGFIYRHVPRDDDGLDIGPKWWNEVINVLTEATVDGTVLIYCHMGINRAPSAVAAWLVHNRECGYLEAWGHVRDVRPIAWASYYPDYLTNCVKNPAAKPIAVDIRATLKKNASKINRTIRAERQLN